MQHPLLLEQIREHLGEAAAHSPELARLWQAVSASYRKLEHRTGAGVPSAAEQINLSAIFRSMADGILVRSTDDRIIEHNPAAERLLGLDFRQMRGFARLPEGWRMICENGRDFPHHQVPSRQTLRDGSARYGVLIGVATTAGEQRWLSFNTEPLHDSAGNLIAAVSTFSEVTGIVPLPQRATLASGMADAGKGAPPRPTLGHIAQRLGVTTATVSMALRHHPRISVRMREKVQTAAEEVGYRPDPRLRHAMTHVRSGRKGRLKSVIHALTNLPSLSGRYVTEVGEAARRRADELGYGFEVMRIGRNKDDDARLNRMLMTRGVEGVLLLPMAAPWQAHDLIDWSRFSVVAANRSVRRPDFDRVTADLAASVQGTIAQLAGLGYRRIGAVFNATFDEVVNHSLTAALMPARLSSQVIEPFYYRAPLVSALEYAPVRELTASPGGVAFRSWFERERPDSLVVDCESVADIALRELRLSAPSELGVAVLNRASDSRYAGWEERADLVGKLAMELLDRKICALDRGEPRAPVTKLVKGRWQHAPSVRGHDEDMIRTG